MDNNSFNIENVKWSIGERGLYEAYYKLKIPSVSTILAECVPDPEYDAFVQAVGAEKAKKIMEAAGQRGTSMHAFIEHFIERTNETKDPSAVLLEIQKSVPALLKEQQIPEDKINEGLDLFYKFYYCEYANIYKNVYGIELSLYSSSAFYRGKLDIAYISGPFLNITDFKTSSEKIKKGSIKEKKYKLQLGGYAYALDEMLLLEGKSVNSCNILCINKKDDFIQNIVCEGDELEENKQEFKTLCIEWHKKNNQEFIFNK